jgi:hypothetical protein
LRNEKRRNGAMSKKMWAGADDKKWENVSLN